MAISWSTYSKRILHASVIAEMIEKLPPILFPDEGPKPPLLLWQAGIESFFVNLRALVEFLGIRERSRDTDCVATDILPTWSPPKKTGDDADTWTTLNDHWETATKSVVHFTDFRVQSDIVPTRQMLDEMANDILTLWEQFAGQVEAHPFLWHRGQNKAFKPDGTQGFPGPAV